MDESGKYFWKHRKAKEMLMKRFWTVTFALSLLAACSLFSVAEARTGFVYSSSQSKQIIQPRAEGVIQALRDRHMGRLAGFVHPEKGVQFSPYAHARAGDQKFTVEQVRQLGKTARKYSWGEYDGTGKPILLTWREYFERFVYSHDFSRAEEIQYNKVTPRGNTLNNLQTFYPGSIAVEYFLPGTSPEFAGMDWRSLWLVFQPRGKTWYLVGIAHDEWTI